MVRMCLCLSVVWCLVVHLPAASMVLLTCTIPSLFLLSPGTLSVLSPVHGQIQIHSLRAPDRLLFRTPSPSPSLPHSPCYRCAYACVRCIPLSCLRHSALHCCTCNCVGTLSGFISAACLTIFRRCSALLCFAAVG